MAPRNVDIPLVENEVTDVLDPAVIPANTTRKVMPLQIVWKNVFRIGVLHLMGLYGMLLVPWIKPVTWIWLLVTYIMTGLGITAGAHRLWTHRAYRAKTPLRVLLAIFNSMAFQNDIIEWSRDHRVHHKFSETDADPHNANRGFFFAHCGWLMCRKHPDVKEKGKLVDISDLLNDPVCRMQRKLYYPSVALFCFIIPTVVPWYFWNESAWLAYFVCGVFRYTLVLNVTWTVNSFAHIWGNKPYDRHINPSENFLVAFSAMGEGYHNYHHVFPGDYSTSEYGWRFNTTTFFIDLMAKLGQVEERRTIATQFVERRRQRTGDGTNGFGYM